ncbi:MAG: hypothetical protein V4547_18115 [Bacteroidota bacterium]
MRIVLDFLMAFMICMIFFSLLFLVVSFIMWDFTIFKIMAEWRLAAATSTALSLIFIVSTNKKK